MCRLLITAALGGHVGLISTVTSNALPHVQSGKLRILGVGAPRRLSGALAPHYLGSAQTIRFFQSEDAKLRSAMSALGLAK